MSLGAKVHTIWAYGYKGRQGYSRRLHASLSSTPSRWGLGIWMCQRCMESKGSMVLQIVPSNCSCRRQHKGDFRVPVRPIVLQLRGRAMYSKAKP